MLIFLLHLSHQVRANLVEADFYGFMPWIVIQRVTLPLAVFFHFHSAVVFVELFKEVFDADRDRARELESSDSDVIDKPESYSIKKNHEAWKEQHIRS